MTKKTPLWRRSTYTPRLAAEILRRIAEGESLTAICGPKRKKGMPARLTVYNWLERYPKFRKTYMLARLAQSELYADQAIEIADEADADWGKVRAVARDRLRVETRRWRAAVLAPEVYAERLSIVAQGLECDREALEEPSLEEEDHIAAQIAGILEGARVRKAEREGLDPFPRDEAGRIAADRSAQELYRPAWVMEAAAAKAKEEAERKDET